MWGKITSAFGSTSRRHDDDRTEVLPSILEKHPNLSVFHEAEEDMKDFPLPIPPTHDTAAQAQQEPSKPPVSPSPPPSPSKKKSMLKRLSVRGLRPETPDGQAPSVAKKVKSHLGLITKQTSQISISSSHDTQSVRMSTDTRPSIDSVCTPTTPLDARFGGGSLRSILRDRNTPATGQNVRFFSRDAYKVISPDASGASQSEDGHDNALMPKLSLSKPRAHRPPLAQDLFAPPTTSTPAQKSNSSPPMSPSTSQPTFARLQGGMTPLPPPEISNIFDLSGGRELPPIPGTGMGLLDDAVEVSFSTDGDSSRDSGFSNASSVPSASSAPSRMVSSDAQQVVAPAPSHDRAHSFSFGQTVFRAPAPTLPTPEDTSRLSASALGDAYPGRPPSRNRAMSDSAFAALLRAATPTQRAPEADIRDVSSTSLVLHDKPSKKRTKEREPADPFSANATTYYTPGTMLPPTPPNPTHARKASREEDELWSLRTQLALQSDLVAQYEVDLRARDALVSSLTLAKETLEKEENKRRSAVRAWKKKVAEMERVVRGLEDEIAGSRQESFDRSIMDEASDAALRALHARKAELERSLEGRDAELSSLRGKLEEKEKKIEEQEREVKEKDEGERRLREGIRAAQEQIEAMNAPSRRASAASSEGSPAVGESAEDMQSFLQMQLEQARVTLLGREDELARRDEELARREEEVAALKNDLAHRDEQLAEREEELAHRSEELSQRTDELARCTAEIDSLKSDLAQRTDELKTLHAELEVQWRGTEQAGERMAADRAERNTLQTALVELEQKLEVAEGARVALEEERAASDEEREELERHLHEEQENVDGLTQALQEREEALNALEAELTYAKSNAQRVEGIVEQRNSEIDDLAQRVVASEDDAEALREELTRVRRESERAADEQRRTIAELTQRDSAAREQTADAIREKAQADVAKGIADERVKGLEADVERLRKQVHGLQQESANKEVRITALTKEREQLAEDVYGLNTALDAKQQELELIKRKKEVKAVTAAAISAPRASLVSHRRDSSVPLTNATATPSRPSSRLSDGSTDSKSSSTKPALAPRVSTLGKSVRANGPLSASTATPKGPMGPPPVTKPRQSIATPTPASHSRIPSTTLSRSTIKPASSLAQSASARSLAQSTATPPTVRRTSSASAAAVSARAKSPPVSTPVRANVPLAPALSERDEKENVAVPA
ncbi:hypothetical protein K488DRAFT_84862 [Vararia minispora EC-137]|uniref:Uncharacterized protein n=1 Tax=Vararia minispora EC-137 TaxID=1314806 RepID=A0ACB8QPT5_9AGAM|nr:hypothetical protein K488DRAFT_84862 [Vararia minispora EC-137]